MKTTTLLERAKALAKTSVGTAALGILPISAVVLHPSPASGQVTFDPANVVFAGDSGLGVTLTSASGGSATLPTFDGSVGESSFGVGTYNVAPTIIASALATPAIGGGFPITFQAASLNTLDSSGSGPGFGTGSGTFTDGQIIPVSYEFTLASSNGTITFGAWTLRLDIFVGDSGGSDNMMTFSGTGPGAFSEAGTITVTDAGLGLGFNHYNATLMLTVTPANSGGTFSVNIPAHSIDFNAVPEPTTWSFLAGGFLVTALVVWVRRDPEGDQAA